MRKDERGYLRDWNPTQASPILNIKVQEHQEREVLFSKELEDTLSNEIKMKLGLIPSNEV